MGVGVAPLVNRIERTPKLRTLKAPITTGQALTAFLLSATIDATDTCT